MRKFAAHQVIFLSISAILLIAVLPLPGNYYIAINLFAALCGALLAWIAWKSRKFLWAIPGVAAVVLYLPAFNQPFDKATWIVIDLFFIGIFVSAALSLKERFLEGDFSEHGGDD